MDDLLTTTPMAVWFVKLIDKSSNIETTLQENEVLCILVKYNTQKDEEGYANVQSKMQIMFLFFFFL